MSQNISFTGSLFIKGNRQEILDVFIAVNNRMIKKPSKRYEMTYYSDNNPCNDMVIICSGEEAKKCKTMLAEVKGFLDKAVGKSPEDDSLKAEIRKTKQNFLDDIKGKNFEEINAKTLLKYMCNPERVFREIKKILSKLK